MFTHHEACPECGSRDNLARYSDGSGYCFGCRHYIPAENSLAALRKKLDDRSQIITADGITLPEDASSSLEKHHLAWLKKYGLTNEEISGNEQYKFLSSRANDQLLFVVLGGNGECLFYQARNFNRQPKYLTEGNVKATLVQLDEIHESKSTILTEDAVSAIKVARHAPAMPLFGCALDVNRARRLSNQFDGVILWLDPDKRSEALKQANRYSWMFKDGIKVIWSDKDPKEHTDKEIKEYLQK